MPAPSFASIFGGQSPWQQNVQGGLNGQPVPFATPQQPNTNYVTPQAAQQLAQFFGANAVSQNLNGMASPGSPAPSQPMYGLDFGGGRDVQDPGMAAKQLERGEDPALIAQRYQAGLNNTGWGGPAPQVNTGDMFWNRSTPISQNTPTPEQSAFFAPRSSPQQAPPAATGGSLGGGPLGQYAAILQQMFSQGQQMPGAAFWGGGGGR